MPVTSSIPIDKTARRLAEVCSLATVCMAGLALLSWGLGRWQLWAFGGGYVPMAPSTALAVLLLNSAILLRNRWPGQPVTVRYGFFAAAAVALFGLLVLLQKPVGFELPVEKWLVRTTDTVGGIPVGRMSPLTAFTFLLAVGALLFGQPPFRRRRLLNYASHALALLVLLTGVVFVLGYAAGTPLWYGGLTIPMALLTAVSFLLTGLGLLAAGLGPDLQRLQDEGWLLPAARASRRFEWSLLAAFVVLAVAIGTAGFFGLRRQQAHARQTMQEELAAIADLKVGQIINWRNERLADARFFSKAPNVARDVQSFLADPSSAAARAETLAWLTLLKADNRYAQVTLFDSRLDPRLSVPPRTNDPSAWLRAQVAAVFLTNEAVMTDLRCGETSREIRLDIFFPVFAPSALTPLPAQPNQPSTASPLAVILLRLNPRQFLYPLVQSWPTPSRTAETLLVRREGDEVVYLNELRHRTNTALNLRFPITKPDLPAAIAVREQEGIVEGRDYRGVPVLTAFRRVPDSPWFLGAKMDQAEVYRPLRQQALAVGGIVAVLLVAVALGLGLIWRQRDAVLLSRELASERERKALAERFAHLMQHANDIILLADENWRILEANEQAVKTYGYSLSELQQMHLPDLRPPETRDGFARDVERLRGQGSTVFETMHQRKDGCAFPVENSACIVEIASVKYNLSILRDVTQRREHEREIERLHRLYATLSQVNQAIVRTQSRVELFEKICRIIVEFGGFKMAWIGWLDAETKAVQPMASAGDAEGYLNKLQICADDRPEGAGLTGTALRTGTPCVSDNYLQDPRLKPPACAAEAEGAAGGWHGLAAVKGFHSAAAFPFRFRDEVCGALMLYAGERDFFQPEQIKLLEEVVMDISFALDTLEKEAERKRKERALQESEVRYRRTLDNMLEGCQIIGFDWQYLYVNEAAAQHGRRTKTELLGHTLMEIYPGIENTRVFAVFQHCRDERTTHSLENEFIYPDGARGWFELSIQPIPEGIFILSIDITERKRAEEELRESEEHYRSLFDNMLNGFAYCQMLFEDGQPQDFIYREVNDAFQALTGLGNVAGRKVSEVIPGIRESDPELFEIYGRVALTGKPETFETWVKALSMWFSISVYCPERGYFVAVFDVITERKRAEAHIHHLNRLLRAIRDVNKLIVREQNPERLLAEACKILVQTRGYRLVWIGRVAADSKRVVPVASAGPASIFLEIFPVTWDETAAGLGPIGTALRTRLPWVCQDTATDPRFAPWRESVLARGSGSVAAVPMIHGARLLGAVEIYADHPEAFDGAELGLLNELAGDLAFAWQTIEHEQERKRVEEALRESEARFRQVVEASPVPLLVQNTAGKIEYVNRKFVETFGYNHEDIAASADWFARAFPNPGYRQTVAERWSAMLRKALGEGKDIGPLEVEVACKNGSVRTVELLGTIGGGRSLIAANDITEKKRLEAQFLRNQRMETIGTLAGGIAHDLNNILAPIIMSMPMLREKLPSGEGADLLTMMETSAQRGANVVKQLLTFGRGVTGERVRVQARHLIKEVIKMARQTFPKSITILTAVPADLWLVLGDATQLQQVLLNLCVNAREAMPGGGRLTLAAKNVRLPEEDAGLKPEAKAGPYVLLRVSDTGHGIPPEILDRIFDPFFTTKEHGKGTGLGLSTVLGIVKSHGGFVRVESQVARGSTFEAYLPAVPEAEPLPDAPTPAALAKGRGELILVVDDEAAIRETTRRILERHGYGVVTAAGGREALALYQQRRDAIKLVLTDLMMPGMDGMALSWALLKLNPQVKIIAASGLGEDAKVAELKALGVKTFLAKPYTTDKLFDSLRDMLQEDS